MSTAAKVGAFFLLALAVTGILIWNIEDLKLGRRTAKTVTVEFTDVAGLKEKADVRVAGVLVGRVAKIRLVGGKALVDLELERDVELHQGASAGIQTLGMLGDNYVELLPGPAVGGQAAGGHHAPGQGGRLPRPGQPARARHRDRPARRDPEPQEVLRRPPRGASGSRRSSTTWSRSPARCAS